MASALRLNAVPVAVADEQFSEESEEIGDRSRAPDGQLRLSRQALKRRFRVETTQLDRQLWKALVGMLRGYGDRWGWDSSPWSAKGVGYSSAAGDTFRYEPQFTGGTKRASGGSTTGTFPRSGTACLSSEHACTNLWDDFNTTNQNIRTGTNQLSNTTGFTLKTGAVLSSVTTGSPVQSTRALQCATSGSANSGFTVDRTSAGGTTGTSALTTYTASVYLKFSTGSGACNLRVQLEDVTNAVVGTSKVIALGTIGSAAGWHRVAVSVTTGAGANPTLRLTCEATQAVAFTFLADAFQLEARDYATSWANPTTASATLSHHLLSSEHTAQADLCLMFWTFGAMSATEGSISVVDGDGSLSGVDLRLSASTYAIRRYDAGVATVVSSGALAALAETSWYHWALVVRRNPATGSYNYELYRDGVLTVSATSTVPRVALDNLYVGLNGAGSSAPLGMLVDDLVVLPYAPPASWIAAWYAAYSSTAFPSPPNMLADGFLLDGDPSAAASTVELTVQADGIEVETLQATTGGVHAPDMAVVKFDLLEV